jgi:hypothetical protein
MATRKRRKRVTWVDWVKLAFIVSLIAVPSLYVGLSVAAGEWFGRSVVVPAVTVTTTTTTTTPPTAPN